MTTFPTSGPITAVVEVPATGSVRVTAGDADHAEVEVRPADPRRQADVRDAEATRVELVDGTLVVRAPKRYSLFDKGSALDVTVRLPAGSDLRCKAGVADVDVTGALGRCEVKLGVGSVRIDGATSLRAATGMGDVTADRVTGDVDVTTGSGAVRVTEVHGRAGLGNSNGDTWVGLVTGPVRVKAANGDVQVDRADGDVELTSSNGSLRVQDVAAGTVTLRASVGSIDVGVREGTAAWLDATTKLGSVSSRLAPTDTPAPDSARVQIHAHTGYGDVTVRRA